MSFLSSRQGISVVTVVPTVGVTEDLSFDLLVVLVVEDLLDSVTSLKSFLFAYCENLKIVKLLINLEAIESYS